MAEFLVRFVFEIVIIGALEFLAWVGRVIARVAVPLVTAGRVRVMPVPGNLVVVERWHGMHRLTDGSPVMGDRLAAFVGLTIVVLTLVIAVFTAILLRA